MDISRILAEVPSTEAIELRRRYWIGFSGCFCKDPASPVTVSALPEYGIYHDDLVHALRGALGQLAIVYLVTSRADYERWLDDDDIPWHIGATTDFGMATLLTRQKTKKTTGRGEIIIGILVRVDQVVMHGDAPRSELVFVSRDVRSGIIGVVEEEMSLPEVLRMRRPPGSRMNPDSSGRRGSIWEDEDLENVLVDRWEDIDRRVTNILKRKLRRWEQQLFGRRSALSRVHPLRGYIGSGWRGCVYPAFGTRSRFVVKVTIDEAEAMTFRQVLGDAPLRSCGAIARPFGVFQIQDDRLVRDDEETKVFVIVRENLSPLLELRKRRSPAYQRIYCSCLEPILECDVNELACVLATAAGTLENDACYANKCALQRSRTAYLEGLKRLEATKVGVQLARFLRKLYLTKGIVLTDLRPENLGYRESVDEDEFGEVALLDFLAWFDIPR